jgi:hypothetical protein
MLFPHKGNDRERQDKLAEERRASRFTKNVETPAPRYGLKQFAAVYDAEQAKIAAAPMKKLEKAFNQTLAALRREQVSRIFTEPSEELADRTLRAKDIDGTADQIAKMVLKAAQTGLQGLDIRQSGREKIIAVLRVNPNMDQTFAGTWRAVYDYMQELGVFTEEDVNIPRPVTQPVAQPTPGPTFDDVLKANSVENRTGEKVIQTAMMKELRKDAESAYAQFENEYRTLFFDIMTKAETEALIRIMRARDLNSNSVRDWHRARNLGCRAGFLRDKFLTPDEKLSWDVETGKVPLDTFEQRQEFQRKVAAINKGIPLLG